MVKEGNEVWHRSGRKEREPPRCRTGLFDDGPELRRSDGGEGRAKNKKEAPPFGRTSLMVTRTGLEPG